MGVQQFKQADRHGLERRTRRAVPEQDGGQRLALTSCLELLGHMNELVKNGGQVICATHSPLLTALPGAEIVEVGEHGMRRVGWGELELVDHWRRYLADPQSYLRHVLG